MLPALREGETGRVLPYIIHTSTLYLFGAHQFSLTQSAGSLFFSSGNLVHPSRFGWGLGMQLVAKSDLSTGNSTFASYALKSNDLVRIRMLSFLKHVICASCASL